MAIDQAELRLSEKDKHQQSALSTDPDSVSKTLVKLSARKKVEDEIILLMSKGQRVFGAYTMRDDSRTEAEIMCTTVNGMSRY